MFVLCCAVIQDGRRQYGHVGGEIWYYKTGTIYSQLQILSIRLHRRILYRTLPVATSDDLHVGEVTSWESSVLQYEMTWKIDRSNDWFIGIHILRQRAHDRVLYGYSVLMYRCRLNNSFVIHQLEFRNSGRTGSFHSRFPLHQKV